MTYYQVNRDKHLPKEERGGVIYGDIKEIPKDFIMSRDSDGAVVSKFADDIWVWGNSSKLCANFHDWCGAPQSNPKLFEMIKMQMKIYAWVHLCSSELSFPEIKPISWVSRKFTYIRELASICFSLGVDLVNCSKSPEFNVRLKVSISSISNRGTSRFVRTVEQALVEFNLCGRSNTGASLGINEFWSDKEDKIIDALFQRSKSIAGENKPTKLIPTNVLGNFIGGGLELLEEVESELTILESAFLKYWDALSKGSSSGEKKIKRNTSKYSTVYVMTEFHLEHWEDKYGVDINDRRSILEFLNELHRISRYLTHAFTGMRSSEAEVAPYYCYKYHKIPNFGEVPFFTTRTKKIAQDNYSVPMQWVTSPELEMVVRVAQTITRIFCIQSGKDIDPEFMPLWTTYSSKSLDNSHYDWPIATMAPSHLKNSKIAKRLNTYITREDLDELWEFDFLSMGSEKDSLEVGNPWPFSSHQFRRSLAVYAARSGMVSLPSMGAQYKHISLLMTALYSRSSSYAKNFIPVNSKDEVIGEFKVAEEFQNAIIERSAVEFQEQIMKCESQLLGVKGMAIQRQKDTGDIDVPFRDRAATEAAMRDKRNPMSYRKTPTGGCLRNDLCGSFGIDIVLPCVAGCADAVVIKEKAERYVENLEIGLEYMADKSHAKEATKRVIEIIKVKLKEEG